jgi:ATP-binding cassette, subfamily B, bacterial
MFGILNILPKSLQNFTTNEAACFKLILDYHNFSLGNDEYILSNLNRKSSLDNMYALVPIAEKNGFRTLIANLTLDQVKLQVPLPCIISTSENDSMVLYSIDQKMFSNEINYFISNAKTGIRMISELEFCTKWLDKAESGIVLIIEPSFNSSMSNNLKSQTDFKLKLFKKLREVHGFLPYKLLISFFLGISFTLFFEMYSPVLQEFAGIRESLGIMHPLLLSKFLLFIGVILSFLFFYSFLTLLQKSFIETKTKHLKNKNIIFYLI